MTEFNEQQPPTGEVKKNQFDLAQFKGELIATVEKYRKAQKVDYSDGKTEEQRDEQEEQAKELYDTLIDMCASALAQTHGSEETMKIVNSECLDKDRGRQYMTLFPGSNETDFLRKLLIKVAEYK